MSIQKKKPHEESYFPIGSPETGLKEGSFLLFFFNKQKEFEFLLSREDYLARRKQLEKAFSGQGHQEVFSPDEASECASPEMGSLSLMRK